MNEEQIEILIDQIRDGNTEGEVVTYDERFSHIRTTLEWELKLIEKIED